MEIRTSALGIWVRIPSQKNRARKILALFLSIAFTAFGVYAGTYIILESHPIPGALGTIVFICIGIGYLDAFFWHLKGEEVFIIELNKGFYQKRALFKGFSEKFNLDKDFSIELFDSELHPFKPVREPRNGDGMLKAYGGKVWVWHGKKSFRFGPNLSMREAKAIVQEVETYARKWV